MFYQPLLTVHLIIKQLHNRCLGLLMFNSTGKVPTANLLFELLGANVIGYNFISFIFIHSYITYLICLLLMGGLWDKEFYVCQLKAGEEIMELSYTSHDEYGTLILRVGDLYCFVFLFLHVLFFLFYLYYLLLLYSKLLITLAVLANVCIGNQLWNSHFPLICLYDLKASTEFLGKGFSVRQQKGMLNINDPPEQ